MIDTSKDMALKALLEAASEEAADIPKEVVRAIYQIEKTYQFNIEHEVVIGEIQKLLNSEFTSFQREKQ